MISQYISGFLLSKKCPICPESVQFLLKIFNLNVLAIYIFDFIVLNVQKMFRNIFENTPKCSETFLKTPWNVQKMSRKCSETFLKTPWNVQKMSRKCSETFLKHFKMFRKRPKKCPENVQKMSRKCSEKCSFF